MKGLTGKVDFNISVVGDKPNSGVKTSHMPKIWGIDVEIVQNNTDIISRSYKQDHSDHLQSK